MKEGYAHVSVVLDRSGSMDSVKDDTIGSFNSFIKDQKKEPGECTFSLIQFDDKYEVVHEFKKLGDVPELDGKTFVPRGSTALLDAIGRTINDTGKKLAEMKDSERPERVIFVILTDGMENASREFTNDRVHEMIKHQTEKYNWQFVFLGADQDAIATAHIYGIKAGNSMTISKTAMGMTNTMDSLNNAVKSYRGMSSHAYMFANVDFNAFTEEDRKKQDDLINNSTAGRTNP